MFPLDFVALALVVPELVCIALAHMRVVIQVFVLVAPLAGVP